MRAPRSSDARITTAWLVACVLTVASAIVATVAEDDHRSANVAVTLLVLAMGAVKAWLILDEFMEVRTAPPWLRLLARGWLVGLMVSIVVLYLQ